MDRISSGSRFTIIAAAESDFRPRFLESGLEDESLFNCDGFVVRYTSCCAATTIREVLGFKLLECSQLDPAGSVLVTARGVLLSASDLSMLSARDLCRRRESEQQRRRGEFSINTLGENRAHIRNLF